MERFYNLTIGTCGFSGVTLLSAIPTTDQITEIAKLVIQILIAVSTLIAIFKKKTK